MVRSRLAIAGSRGDLCHVAVPKATLMSEAPISCEVVSAPMGRLPRWFGNSSGLNPRATANRWMLTRPMFRLPLTQLLTYVRSR